MKKSKTQPLDHAHAPPHQNRKLTQSSWKLAQRLILARGIQIWQWKNLKINRWPRPRPTPPKLKSDAIELKIGTDTNFGTQKSNLSMKKSETQPLTTPTPHPLKSKRRIIKPKIGTKTNLCIGSLLSHQLESYSHLAHAHKKRWVTKWLSLRISQIWK